MRLCLLIFVISAVSVALATYGYASTVSFRAELKGANVVPPNESSARGYLNASYDTVSRRLTWTGTQSGLSSKITGIHFHAPASPNKTAGVVETIESLSEGSATISDAHAADLIGGYWYVDIHTRAHPAGEIRGQMIRGK